MCPQTGARARCPSATRSGACSWPPLPNPARGTGGCRCSRSRPYAALLAAILSPGGHTPAGSSKASPHQAPRTMAAPPSHQEDAPGCWLERGLAGALSLSCCPAHSSPSPCSWPHAGILPERLVCPAAHIWRGELGEARMSTTLSPRRVRSARTKVAYLGHTGLYLGR